MYFQEFDSITGPYGVIYADPPWRYKDKCNAGKRGAEHKYPVMKIDEIKALPVRRIAAEDCILFCWVTFPLLQEGIEVIKAWGFRYKTISFNWIKTNKLSKSIFMGMGHYTRSNSEVCLIGTVGRPKIQRRDISSVIIAPRMEHSQKPAEVRKRIELLTSGPKIELFARGVVPEWDQFGNDPGFVI